MRMSFGLEQKMVQKQVLAPRMIQSMEILQLPVLALQEKIEQEMNENPMLEVQEQDGSDTEDSPREEPDAPADSEQEFVVEDGVVLAACAGKAVAAGKSDLFIFLSNCLSDDRCAILCAVGNKELI